MKSSTKANRTGKKSVAGSTHRLESLESRRLLTAWSQQDIAVGIDKAVQNYPAINGSGETVVIIDSGGLDYNHPALSANGKIAFTWNYGTNSTDVFPYDNNSHPTGVAGELAGDPHYFNGQLFQGVASGVKIIQLKASGTWQDQQAFDWVVAHRSQYNIVAVNWTDLNSADASAFLPELQSLRSSGVFVGTPTGNYGGTAWPVYQHAWYQTGSTNVWGSISGFSPSGSNVDIFAPGEVTVTWYWNGQHMDCLGGGGTSWSSPQTVGTAALIHQVNPNYTPDQEMQIMRDSADWSNGYPVLNVNSAITLAYQRAGQAAPTAPSIPSPVATPTPTPIPTPSPTPTGTNPGGVPNGPFNMSAMVTGTSIALQFYNNADNQSGFVITRSTSPNGTYSPITTISTATGLRQAVSYTDTGLTSGVTYYYQAYAVNGAMHSSVVSASATIQSATPTPIATAPVTTTTTTTAGTSPFNGTLFSAGSVIEAEWYDNGGANNAFHTVSNYNESGKSFRGTDTVDVSWSNQANSNYVGWTHAGEWLKYSINASTAGTYQLQARVASDGNGGTFHIEVDGKDVTGAMTVPNSGGWNNFTTVTKDGVALTAGNHTIRVVMDGNGQYGYVGNFDWFKFNAGGTATATPPAAGAYVPNTYYVPNGPFGLNVTAVSSTSLALKFNDNSDNEASYVIERANWSGGPYSVIATIGVDQATSQGTGLRQWTDTGLSSGTSYYYRVTAVNQIGASSATAAMGTTN